MHRLVQDCMTRKVVWIAPHEPLFAGIEKMAEGGIRHVLVMDGQRIRGILSNRDLIRASMRNPEKKLELHETSIEDVMTRAPLQTVRPKATLGEAAGLMHRHKVNALPVLGDDGRVVGILTTDDLLAALAQAETRHGVRPDP